MRATRLRRGRPLHSRSFLGYSSVVVVGEGSFCHSGSVAEEMPLPLSGLFSGNKLMPVRLMCRQIDDCKIRTRGGAAR